LREEKLSSREKKYKTKNVRTDEGEEIARRMKAHMFLECSCKTFEGVDEIFHEAARYFLHHEGPRIEKEKCCKCLLL
jgi:Ras family protein A